MERGGFDESRWADLGFSQDYRDEADSYLPFRRLFVQTAKSVVGHFLPEKASLRILDLGCGDGFFVDTFGPRPSDDVVLVDGSSAMLEAAERRLAASTCRNIEYVRSSFQELIERDPLSRRFDFICSSLAMHHLSARDKASLYSYIYHHLDDDGVFINYDVVLAPSEPLETWYVSFWQESLAQAEITEEIQAVPLRYKDNPDNIPDSLEYQMEALRDIGFSNVDCYLKFGVFSLFGGTK
jgi:tRNA (cmo5U34)-methyltransferase